MEYASKKQLIDELKKQLATRDNQAIKGLMTIYSSQSDSEKKSGNVYINGFIPSDSDLLTCVARLYEKNKKLSEYQLKILKIKMPKYAGQLINGSISKGLIKKVGKSYVF